MEQHPVVGDDFFGLVKLARTALRVAAAQVARRQHGLHTGVPQHGLGRQPDLAEQSLGAATREIKHRFGLGRGGDRVADDGHVVFVFDIEQSARGFLW